MTIPQAFAGVRRVLLDTGPVVYAFEKNADWGVRARAAVEYLFDTEIEVVATTITLAECLAGAPKGVVPVYVKFLTRSQEITFVTLDASTAILAGELRQATGLKLPDCLQVASALSQVCDLLLTNDRDLARRQRAIRTLLLADIEA